MDMYFFRLNKLVRDRIVENQLELGQKPTYRSLNRDEHITELIKKLGEESREMLGSNDYVSEIADIQQVVDDLKQLLGLSDKDVSERQIAKSKKVGGFSKGLYVETLGVSKDDAWADYYLAEPERFPQA